ncbi:glutamate-5-semialdehyde dehydrogenase [Xylella fastidiosa]|uniref:glutamate-5-semialdehyde dehydrogenase n=1 Tax=Xylella fastidiosa TaxID=2371 RepID=UPI003DA5A7A9
MPHIRHLAQQCRDAARILATLSTDAKRRLLETMATALNTDAATILAANAADLDAARTQQVGTAMLDRLALDPQRLAAMADALRDIAALPDPVGQVTRDDRRPNGIHIQKIRVPLGVIAMIYEARPNVTADAAALCIKAGNGIILRGGSEAIRSNIAIATALQRALRLASLPETALILVQDMARHTMLELLQLSDLIDLVIPRGGEGLIRFVAEHARIPVIKHYKGVCHQFVDASADIEMAIRLLIDGKTTRPAACNALETLLVHTDIAPRFLPAAAAALRPYGVQLRGDHATCTLLPDVVLATDADYAAEYLDLILAIRIVPNLDAALEHIRRYGSDHTEVIVTADPAHADTFVQQLPSAVVMVNASSRFSDGGALGLGAEIGISTTRLHAYGPMGLDALTVERFVVRGQGQVRHCPPYPPAPRR